MLAYFHSTTTLNYIRSLLTSGFASLHSPRDWSLSHVRSPALRRGFETIIDGLSDALDFSRTIGADAGASNSYEQGGGRGTLGEVDFYTSHEGLMLAYESALTRELPVPSSVVPPQSANVNASSASSATSGSSPSQIKAHYNTGAHFLWIGDRTRQLTGAHVEYFRGIRNPIGIKVGPTMQPEELVRVLEIVNPEKEMGRVTLITRYGASKHSFLSSGGESSMVIVHPLIDERPSHFMKAFSLSLTLVEIYFHHSPSWLLVFFPEIREIEPSYSPPGGGTSALSMYIIDAHLPAHIRVVQKSGHPVAWICDPMHGNTQTSSSGLKTRHFNNIIAEITASLRIHTECDSRLNGVSLEFTGELNEEGYSVTECLGGSMELAEEELGLRYQSFCDPRLNFEQSLDIAFLMSNHFKKERRGMTQSSVIDALYQEFKKSSNA
ncbi:hypothetical protein D9613_001213 [Agrocybe pediades]|uniref:Phospho-2-dehydro-3-deoxyheptonate aldolase n=1 Tax=Agrocybe pediades TaxID=84607 RepID=A0A8H4R1W3_9AGAR|nr:hypothetical protein D9613_001213 [Agrocybe pediades]